MSPLAKIIKHSRTSPVSHTILINNTPQAHKIFGVLNPPLPSANQNTVFDQSANQKTALDNTANQNEIIVQEDITSEDLDFSDVDRNDDAITNDVTKTVTIELSMSPKLLLNLMIILKRGQTLQTLQGHNVDDQ